ncbi:transcriptional repressor NrdR [Candidatus Woesearchaeota archaeon]|nr:transcriptional repressor NrdR [Candidatus Woesearchaeota archaeon]
MKCPFCNYPESRVIETREIGNAIRRRRECLKCGKRFTTYERIEHSPIIVVKKDGSREKFDIEKIKQGVLKACEKRPVTMDQIEDLASKVESEILALGKSEVSSKIIGLKVMKHLKKLDRVAYIRFASVYREFADVEDFFKELKRFASKTSSKA